MATENKEDLRKVESNEAPLKDTSNLDAAAQFLADYGGSSEITAEESARVRRKIDWRLLPLMATMYFMQQLDKSAVSFASVFNIQKDANLVYVSA